MILIHLLLCLTLRVEPTQRPRLARRRHYQQRFLGLLAFAVHRLPMVPRPLSLCCCWPCRCLAHCFHRHRPREIFPTPEPA